MMKTMKITPREREFLLSQVQIILSECQRLVSQLSQVQCEEDIDFVQCPDVQLNPEEDDVSSVASKQSQDLLWDPSEDFPVYTPTPSAFYNLVFTEESFEDEMISDSETCQIVQKSSAKECSFVNKIKHFISSNFPNNVFSQQKSDQLKQEILNENVFPEFQSMWRHSIVGDLFIQSPEPNEICTTTSPATEIVYRTIDFTKVDTRRIANIPKPKLQPKYGCSEEPDFYNKTYWVNGFEYVKSDLNFYKPHPFGGVDGYETNIGIVPVPEEPVHGHIWSPDSRDWVLNAIFPDESSPARAPWSRPGTTPRRMPSTSRRRWRGEEKG